MDIDLLTSSHGEGSALHDSGRIPVLLQFYRRYLEQGDSAGFIQSVSCRYTLGSLARLLVSGNRIHRRSAALALGQLGDYSVNHPLGIALSDPDRGVRMLVQNSIDDIWSRAGNEDHRRTLAMVRRLNHATKYEVALHITNGLIADAPKYAEAWHQRGAALFSLGCLAPAQRNFRHAAHLNPFQFRAIASSAQCDLKRNDSLTALVGFRRALRINPDLEGIRLCVARLQRAI